MKNVLIVHRSGTVRDYTNKGITDVQVAPAVLILFKGDNKTICIPWDTIASVETDNVADDTGDDAPGSVS